MWTKKESALVLLAPEAEGLVKSFRDRFDPAGGEGVPAHLTVLYPFIAPDRIGESVLAELRGLFGGIAPIEFALVETRRFPGVLYLAPHPAEPLRALIKAVAARYPDTPPYGGIFSEVVPHLTVAQPEDPAQLDAIAAEFEAAAAGRLPIPARAEQVVLMDNRAGPWEISATFQLGGR